MDNLHGMKIANRRQLVVTIRYRIAGGHTPRPGVRGMGEGPPAGGGRLRGLPGVPPGPPLQGRGCEVQGWVRGPGGALEGPWAGKREPWGGGIWARTSIKISAKMDGIMRDYFVKIYAENKKLVIFPKISAMSKKTRYRFEKLEATLSTK